MSEHDLLVDRVMARLKMKNPGSQVRVVARGNQQPLASAEAERTGDVGLTWIRGEDGGVYNADLAQSCQVYSINEKFVIVLSYNDGSETTIASFDDEKQAWAQLDDIARRLGADR